MIKKKIIVFSFLILSSLLNAKSISVFENLIASQDYLGARIYLRKNSKKINNLNSWMQVRKILQKNAEFVGYDLLFQWDKKSLTASSALRGKQITNHWKQADQKMLAGQFNDAFERYQKVAQWLVKRKKRLKETNLKHVKIYKDSIDIMYPFLLQSMGRALYGARRYRESYTVYDWIPRNYVRFRQVLFEKMWAGFRAKRYDQALGSAASMYSYYFSRNVHPEAFLVQSYLYKQLCRKQDLKRVINDIKKELKKKRNSSKDFKAWAVSEPYKDSLYRLSYQNRQFTSSLVSSYDRSKEKEKMKAHLKKGYARDRLSRIKNLKQILAYAQLASVTGGDAQLKGLGALPSRSEIFKSGKEIWPANEREEWADEVGMHRFLGRSLCRKR